MVKKEKKNNGCNSEGIPWTEYYRIVNKIEEAFAKTNLCAYESRVVSAIRRKTFGFQKRTDHISQEQFEEMTGLDRRNNSKAIKSLVKRNILVEKKARGKGKINSYKFRKDTQNWDKGIHGKGVKIDTFRKGVKVDTFNEKDPYKKGIHKHAQKVSTSVTKRYPDRYPQIKQKKTNKDEDSIKNVNLNLKGFLNLLKQSREFESLPNFKKIESFFQFWDELFFDKTGVRSESSQKKMGGKHFFFKTEDIKSINSLSKYSLEKLKNLIFQFYKYLRYPIDSDNSDPDWDIDFTIKNFCEFCSKTERGGDEEEGLPKLINKSSDSGKAKEKRERPKTDIEESLKGLDEED